MAYLRVWQRHGQIEGSLNAPYQDLDKNLAPGGLIYELVNATGRRVLFYCAHGERSAMAVKEAGAAGIRNACHIEDGIEGWKLMGGPVTSTD